MLYDHNLCRPCWFRSSFLPFSHFPRPSDFCLHSGSSLSFSPSQCAPPVPGTGPSSQTRRGAFDKSAWNLARFTSGPFLFIRQKAAYAVPSLALVSFALDYSPPLRDSSPLYDRPPCSISIFFLLLRSIIFLPLSSKFGSPPTPLCVFTLAVVAFLNLFLTLSAYFLSVSLSPYIILALLTCNNPYPNQSTLDGENPGCIIYRLVTDACRERFILCIDT